MTNAVIEEAEKKLPNFITNFIVSYNKLIGMCKRMLFSFIIFMVIIIEFYMYMYLTNSIDPFLIYELFPK